MKRTYRIWLWSWLVAAVSVIAQEKHAVTIQVREGNASALLPCRIHLKNAQGTAFRSEKLPFWRDHLVCPGEAQLELPAGEYTYEVERGPEYSRLAGAFNCPATTNLQLKLSRVANMAAEGWWSGELHVHRRLESVELLMQAEDLHVAPVITWWNNNNPWRTSSLPERVLRQFDGNRFYHLIGGEDEREGGALLFFNMSKPLDIRNANREFPSPMQFVSEARKIPGAWIDIEKPFWWDLPIWAASGQIDSIGIANNHMCRTEPLENEAWGKPRDVARLPPPRGNGFWSQEIYYQLLNSGLRIPPSAGSASGVLPNPVGYNRVYVQLGPELNYDKWWEGLRAGRSFVSNGPLLRCRANGKPPGHLFSAADGKISIELEANIFSHDPIPTIEVIRNGKVELQVPWSRWQRTGRIGSLEFTNSGWFLVRTIADHPKTFRFASTAPYYVEIGQSKRRVSRSAAQFFLDWARERRLRVKLENADQRSEVLKHHDTAEKFWVEQVAKANAE